MSKTTSPLRLYGLSEDYLNAAEFLMKEPISEKQFMQRLYPTYFLLGHSAECLFKSCISVSKKTHDIKDLYKLCVSEHNLKSDSAEDRILAKLSNRYYPAEGSVRYPLKGYKTFFHPNAIIKVLHKLRGEMVKFVVEKYQRWESDQKDSTLI